MYGALVGVGVVCGLLIAGAFRATAPVIAQNRAEALERAIFEVVPDADSSEAFADTGAGGFVPAAGAPPADPRVHAAYDADGRLVGVAIEASAMGYQDVITLLYGYSFTEQAIVGMVVLESRETPGLGDKIEADPEFRRNFDHLDVALDGAGTALLHPIEAVKRGQKTAPYQIDTITGATISSSTVARLIGESAAHWIPRVASRRAELEREGGGR